jgi:hypothetical protein
VERTLTAGDAMAYDDGGFARDDCGVAAGRQEASAATTLPDEAHLGVGARGVVFVVAGGGVDVAALVGGDHHAGVLRQPLHPLLHPAVVLRAAVVAPASCTQQTPPQSGYLCVVSIFSP